MTPSPPMADPSAPITIRQGYRPGLIGRVVTLHAKTYSRWAGFGSAFESKVAGELAAFIPRLDRPGNALWYAEREAAIVGSIAIDGEDLGDNRAHLRWFIVDPDGRGRGLGRRLLGHALDFVDQHGFAETRLWTLKGLEAACALYEQAGFTLADSYDGDQWGRQIAEQVFVRRRGHWTRGAAPRSAGFPPLTTRPRTGQRRVRRPYCRQSPWEPFPRRIAMAQPMYQQRTRSIHISVEPFYVDDQSSPASNRFVFGYRVKIDNEGQEAVQLVSRYWQITDSLGRTMEVEGAGVVGEQPMIEPGDHFEYTSGTPLSTPSGVMIGRYQMVTASGETFEADIPAFSLDAPGVSKRLN